MAPSPRILAYLAQRGGYPSASLALTVAKPFKYKMKPEAPAPDVAITPCDPWPRPYYLERGLRRVAPYHYTYNTFCKERWRGRTLYDIFSKEFRDRPKEYYVCFSLSLSLLRMKSRSDGIVYRKMLLKPDTSLSTVKSLRRTQKSKTAT